MRKFTFVLQALSGYLFYALLFISNNVNGQCLSGTLEGYVYTDSNFDGVSDQSETGTSGVLVRVYNSHGHMIGQSITGNNGFFNVQGLNDGEEYRVVYDIPANAQVSSAGINNRTEVQFVTVPFCNSQLGIIEGQINCTSGAELFLTCFVNGLGANSPLQETVVGLSHDFNAGTSVNAYANQSETGAVWGITFKNSTQEIFTSAFVKQHAALTSHGHDAIFATDLSSNTPQTNLFAKLSDLGQAVGNLSVTNSSICNYGHQVGKIGLGALIMDDSEEHLYVTNLFNNTVVKIKTENPTASNTVSYTVPNPGCSFNDYRVFALKIYRSELYVGVTCTGETSDIDAETSFHIYKMNMNSGTFNLIFSTDEADKAWDNSDYNKNSVLWLKDIEFADDDHMILGIADKSGDTYCNGASSRVDDLFGDILLVYNDNNTWKLENNGQTSSRTGTGVGNGQGPGGGEFFGDDFFPKDPANHSEVALGSIFVLPNSQEVVATVYDPLYNTYSGGLHRYNTLTGQKTGSKELYNHNFSNYFGKASGFGDVTARCGTLPVEIGNLVWIDENANGLQDASEKSLSGVKLVICDANCNEIGSTTTDSNGNYLFNSTNVDADGDGQMDGLISGNTYYVSLDPSLYDSQTSAYIINQEYYYPTIIAGDARINSNLNGDLTPCTDPTTKNLPMVEVIANAGNLTGFDIGIIASNNFDLALMKVKNIALSPKIGQIVSFDIEVYNQGGLVATEYEIVDYITEAFRFDESLNPGWVFDGRLARKMIKTQLVPGTSHKETIRLMVLPSQQISDYVNFAEIAYAKDITGAIASDSDSTADDTMENDTGGQVNTTTDNELYNDGTIDEDDHDPAFVEILDLALINIVRDDRNYDIGEKVTFDMTVYNQGNVATTSIEVTNQFPESLTFNQSENIDWVQTSGSTVSTTINEVLEPGASTTVSITLDVLDNNGFRNIVDYAEISGFTSDNVSATIDFDSTPDVLFNNDKGGNPYDYTDNMIEDHGSMDEDDHDPAFVRVRLIDLALKKYTLTEAQNPGDIALFDIDIINQGEISVRTVTLVDYLPEHTVLADDSWTPDASDPTGKTVYKVLDFPEGFAPGAIHTESVSLSLDMNIEPGLLVNVAEIAQVIDFNGMDISDLDIDSKADMKNDNDAGGNVHSDKDDFLDGNGIDDEDDHDPAALYVAMIDVVDNCICMNNASNSFDGQFTEIIEVTAPTGQTWKVDFAVGIYDPSSASPPVAPKSFATGDTGYTLVETPLFDGNSKYRLTGRIIDNSTYSLRVFNEDAAYLQTSGGGSLCSYDDIVIVSPTEGLSGVCTGSTHTYTVENTFGCNDFSWSLNSGGFISGPSNQNSVEVTWTTIGGPYTLSLAPNCINSCLSPVNTQIKVGLGDGAMACRQNINVSLGLDCTTEVEANMVLTNPAGSGVVYQVMVLDDHNQLIPNNVLTEEHLWSDVMVKIINPCNGNSCWAVASVEDKMAPMIQCDDIDLPCWQMDSYEPIVIDNCTDASYTLLSETIQPISCDDDYIKEVVRIYVASDEFGNQSEECIQSIKLERINLDDIDWPTNFMLLDNTNLSCMDDMYDETGFPRLEITGVPYLHGGELYPLPDFYCNIGIDYSDFLVTEFGCVKKIMRTWTVYEAWCTVGESRQYVQTIEIVDTFDPVVSCPQSVTVSSDGGTTCSATVTLDLPSVTDDCSSEFEVDISYPTGFLDNVTQAKEAVFDVGVNEVTYTVYDGCDNSGTCVTYVTVVDEAPPTAVCDQNTIVSLRSDGTAKAFAQTFDDGSFDDCSLFKMLVRRMNSNCDCHVPVYDNMRYLGERSGRYYYLSKFKTHGFKAFAYSQAFGGFLATLESFEEQEWLHTQASQYTSGNYYIGLSDEGHQGTFSWANHAQPGYNNWMNGSPNNIGDNVVTNTNGYWEVVNGDATEAYFVMEVSDPCSFSNEIHFCCEDVSDNQMVIFRVVDYFGRYNDCMVNVEVQDKVAPDINCPADMTIDCTTAYDLNDLSAYGTATATDVCGVTLTESATDTINNCSVGEINRIFTAFDLNGSSNCEQTIYVENSHPFNPATIIWPLDFSSDKGCGVGELHPDNLPAESSYPVLITDQCDLVAPSYADQTFSFAGTGANACLKILRTWTVIDWCEMDSNPNYVPAVYEQTIKITNTEGPTLVSGCDTLVVFTEDCSVGSVNFAVVADDDCTPDNSLDASLEIVRSSDNSVEYSDDIFSNLLSFSGDLPIGEHVAFASFEDMCGNKSTCAKIIQVVNVKPPTAACIQGLSVALVPMDLDDDGTPDTEMTCVFPEMIDASSTHICGNEINLSFSADTTDDKRIYECHHIGVQEIELWVTDEFGNTDKCVTTVEVQDNNFVDFCPRFDLAMVKTLDTQATPGPFMQGSQVTFNLNVINQGNVSAYNVNLVDYIPDGLTLDDSNWTEVGGKATMNNPISFLQDSTEINRSIRFTIDNDFMGFSITNIAEISSADNDNDPNNLLMEDSDSDADDVNDDTIGGDNEVNNNNGDEDDHDPATIDVEQVYDLALVKTVSGSGPFVPGGLITYDIAITNEGTLDAFDIDVMDIIPTGLILDDGNWTTTLGGAFYNIAIPSIPVGQTETISITFQIDPDYMGGSILNQAEIIDPDNDDPDDVDSDPDISVDNDDNNDGVEDDDEDDEMINITHSFDLALLKVIDTNNTPSTVHPGDKVTFDITVYNQGTLDATDVVVRDYISSDMSFTQADNADFTQLGTILMSTIPYIPAGGSASLSITIEVNDDFSGIAVVNNAEIISATNTMGLVDEDDPLSNTNDGSTNELSTDNDINDLATTGIADNPNDEDDYDPALVDIDCNLPPHCATLGSIEVFLNANGEVTITPANIDNNSFAVCDASTGISLSIDNDSFNCTDIGTGNIVNMTVTDNLGNVSTGTCQTNVTVSDNIPPTVSCMDVTVDYVNGNPVLVLTDVTQSSENDNCMVDNVAFNLSGVVLTTLPCLPQTAQVVATDQSGNAGTCSFLITIENDPPIANCATTFDVLLGVDGTMSITADMVDNGSTDDCTDALDLILSIDQSSFDCNDLGTETVTLTVTDESGLTDECSTSLNIVDDMPPLALCQDLTVNLSAGGSGSITAAQVNNGSTDNCTPANQLILSINNMSFDCSDVTMMNMVTLTVTDGSGNDDDCTAMITVNDLIPPVAICHPDFTVSLDGTGNASIVVGDILSSSSDACGLMSETIDINSLDCDDAGFTTTITATVTDVNGNSSTCSTDVTVENEAPTANCETTLSVILGINGTASITTNDINNSSTDDCTADNDLILTLDQSSFDCTDLGILTVTLTVTDAASLSDQCSTELNIVDNMPPLALCQDLTVNLNAGGSGSITAAQVNNGSTDNCTPVNQLILSIDNMSFDCSDVTMMNTVTLTVTDGSGNDDDCTAMITVNDLIPPVVTCHPDFTVTLDGNGEASVTVGDILASSSDACGISTEVIDINSFDCDDTGSTISVTATVTDVNGNSSTCSTDVSVVDDNDPTCTLNTGLTIPANQALNINDLLASFNDDCSTASADTTIDPADGFDCNMLGTQTVTVTVSDDSGNESTCSTSVTVVDVTTPVCQAMDITIQLDNIGEALITAADVDDGSTAGCSTITDLSVTPNIFACNDVGDNVVTLTVTSSNGMTSSCTSTVSVEDDIPPSITCIANVTFDLNSNGVANIVIADILTSSTDGCGILSEVIDISSFDCSDKGSPITVTATVTDMNNNVSTCSSQVTVEDNAAPECTLLPNLEFVPDVTIDISDVLDTFTDNCATGTATITTQTEFDCSDVGMHTTIVMVTDTCGNSNTCSAVIEIVDNQTPTCVTMDITVSLDDMGGYDLDPSEIDDGSSAACGGTVTLAVDPDEFDCSDLGDQLVTLTVTSSGGVTSTCTAQVTIEDNSPPTIVCPANMTLPCNSDLTDLTQYGTATASDNCDTNVSVTVNNIFDVNACNVGTVEREFTATDNVGNTATCMQLITIDPPVNPITVADITWPATPFDAGDCIPDPDNIDSGMPTINTSNADCFNISISFFDVDPTPGTSGCNDIYERNWMVVDSCQLNGGTTGIFTFVQIINLNDSVGPMISGPSDMTIILDPMTCDTFLNLPATISDCIGGFSATNDSPHADSNATEDATGTYPAGVTDITITAIDTCGNESFYTYTVNVIDTSTVIFSCDKIIETMTSALVVPVLVEAAEIEITTMCSDTVFDVSFSNLSPDIDTIFADCSFVGLTNYTVYLWSGNVIIDSCTNLLQILDGGGFCPNPLIGTISGSISTEDDRMVDDVFVDLVGSEFPAILTAENGQYAFPAMPYGGSYEIKPFKDTDPLNGVSTLDLIEIQRHILGIQPLTSPYKLIAADVDNSGSITSLDLLELRKLILGVYEVFPSNTSWRMVDASYNFIDPYNPFLYDIHEDYEIGIFDNSMDIDFIGVKVGDVNNSASANNYDKRVEERSVNDFNFVVNEQKLKKGDVASIIFSSESMQTVDGYQYTLKIDNDKAEIQGFIPIDPTMDLNNVNLSHSDKGIIHISWNRLSDYGTERTQLFEIVVKSKSDGWVSDITSVMDRGIPAQAYFENEIQDLNIEFRNEGIADEDLILYQNQPNPWLQSTDIKFYSPVSGDVILTVYDINGRVVHTRNMTSSKGLNKIELRKTDVGSTSGILYYELISGNDRLMEKMLLLR